MTWVSRLSRIAPISAASLELVRFGLQKLENPEISGIEYQQGTLVGYESRQYLLEKWGYKCAYCSAVNVPLEVEHVHPKSKGGTNRVSNLAISCHDCNTRKGNKDISEFLQHKPELLQKIMSQAKRPLKDATAVNATRWALYESLKATGLPVEVGSGGRTKFNRTMQHFSKEHWIDAACVGETGANVIIPDGMLPLLVKATGHGNRKMCYTDAYGFPTKHRTNQKFHHGFQTGDMVKAVIPAGKYAGEFTGRIMVRKRPCFALKLDGRQFDVHPKHLTRLHGADGYSYA